MIRYDFDVCIEVCAVGGCVCRDFDEAGEKRSGFRYLDDLI